MAAMKLHSMMCAGAVVCSLWGCGGAGASIEGRWTGKIFCLGDSGDLTLGLTLGGDLGDNLRNLYGKAQIRIKDSNADYDLKGELDLEVLRLLECKNSSCESDTDCADRLDEKGNAGKSKCAVAEGVCIPCYDQERWSQVRVTLRSSNVQLPTPGLELWRYGDNRLEGTIKLFCPDENIQIPQVKLSKS